MGIPVWRLSDLDKSKDQSVSKERSRRSPIRRAQRRRLHAISAAPAEFASETSLSRSRSIHTRNVPLQDFRQQIRLLETQNDALRRANNYSTTGVRGVQNELQEAESQRRDLEAQRRALHASLTGATTPSVHRINNPLPVEARHAALQNEIGRNTDRVATPSTFLRTTNDETATSLAESSASRPAQNTSLFGPDVPLTAERRSSLTGPLTNTLGRIQELRQQLRQLENRTHPPPADDNNVQSPPRVVDQLHEIVIDQPLRIPREALPPRTRTAEEEDRIIEEYEERHRVAALARFGPNMDVDTEDDDDTPPASRTIYAPPAYPEYQEQQTSFPDHVDEELNRAEQVNESAGRTLDRGTALLNSTLSRPYAQPRQPSESAVPPAEDMPSLTSTRLPGVDSILAQPYVYQLLHTPADVPVPPMAFPPRLLRETTSSIGANNPSGEEPLFTGDGFNFRRLPSIRSAIFTKSAEDSLCDALCYMSDFFPHWSHYTDVWRLWDLCTFLDNASPTRGNHGREPRGDRLTEILVDLHTETTKAIFDLFMCFCRQKDRFLEREQRARTGQEIFAITTDGTPSLFEPEVHPNTGLFITEDARNQSRALGHFEEDNIIFEPARSQIDAVYDQCRESRALLSEVLSLPQARTFRSRLGGRQVSPEDELLG